MLASISIFFQYLIKLLDTIPYFTERIKRAFNGNKKPYEEENIQNKIVLITGANSGLGKQCVYEMVRRGAAKVILACRNVQEGLKAVDAIQELTTATTDGQMEVMELDLASLESIRKFVHEFKEKYNRLDILINNAGFYDSSSERKTTKDGFEQHFGVNHLGHFLLTNLLLDRLKKSDGNFASGCGDSNSNSRVITVSSHAQILQFLNLDDVMLENSSLGLLNFTPYANSKYANSLFAKELARREGKNGIRSYSIGPGMVVTKFYDSKPWILSLGLGMVGETVSQGCETIVYLAVAKEVNNNESNGHFYHFQKIAERTDNKLSNDLAESLWNLSAKLVNLED